MSSVVKAIDTLGRNSEEGRAKLHVRLDEIRRDQAQISSRIGQLEDRMARVEPAAQTVSEWKAQRSALLWAIGALGAVITFAVALGNVISSWFKGAV